MGKSGSRESHKDIRTGIETWGEKRPYVFYYVKKQRERTEQMNADFWKAALIRAIKTVCQTAIATIGTAIVITDVHWMYVLSASALSGILSILTSIAAGLPEVDLAETLYALDNDPEEYEEEDEEGDE